MNWLTIGLTVFFGLTLVVGAYLLFVKGPKDDATPFKGWLLNFRRKR